MNKLEEREEVKKNSSVARENQSQIYPTLHGNMEYPRYGLSKYPLHEFKRKTIRDRKRKYEDYFRKKNQTFFL